MNIEKTLTQMRKGLLELCILSVIDNRGQIYSSEILNELKNAKKSEYAARRQQSNIDLSHRPNTGSVSARFAKEPMRNKSSVMGGIVTYRDN